MALWRIHKYRPQFGISKQLLRLISSCAPFTALVTSCVPYSYTEPLETPAVPIGYWQLLGPAAISPDGETLAFLYRNTSNGPPWLYTCRTDGSGLTKVAALAATSVTKQLDVADDERICAFAKAKHAAYHNDVREYLTWSPDGVTFLATTDRRHFEARRDGTLTWWLNLGKAFTACGDRLALWESSDHNTDARLALSPDGKRIALQEGLIIDRAGQVVDYLFPLLPKGRGRLRNPTWSADGKSIAYTWGVIPEGDAIASRPESKLVKVAVIDLVGRNVAYVELPERWNFMNAPIRWEAGTNRIYGHAYRDYGTLEVQSGIASITPDGKDFQLIAVPRSMSEELSVRPPKAYTVVGDEEKENRQHLAEVDLKTGEIRRLLSNDAFPVQEAVYAW